MMPFDFAIENSDFLFVGLIIITFSEVGTNKIPIKKAISIPRDAKIPKRWMGITGIIVKEAKPMAVVNAF